MSDKIKNIDLEEVLYSIIRESEEEITPDAMINRILGRIGDFLHAERCYIFEEHKGILDNTYEWCAEGITPQIANLKNIDISVADAWYEFFNKGENVIIHDIEDIKESQPEMYEILAMQDIHSLISGPLLDNNKIIGFYGIDNPPLGNMPRLSKFIEVLACFVMSAIRTRDIETLSYRDQLTNAKNRHALYRDLTVADKFANVGVVYCDVIGLKQTNDREGHTAGDKLLVNMFNCIMQAFPENDVYRIGGDEFIVLAFNAKEKDLRIKALNLEQSVFDAGMNLSIGISYSQHGLNVVNVDALVNEAENNMYHSKRLYYKTEMGQEEIPDTRIPFRHNILESDCRNILDSLINIGVYVITEKTHEILYYNRRVKEISPNVKLGMVCHDVWPGSCDNCPLNSIGEAAMNTTINYGDPFGDIVEITAFRIMWRDEVPAFLIRVAPASERKMANNYTNPLLAGNALGTYVINKNYELIAYSNNCKKIYPQLECGKICYKALFGREKPCVNCSAKEDFDLQKLFQNSEDFFDITSTSIPLHMRGGESARAVVVYNPAYSAFGNYNTKKTLNFANVEDEKYRDYLTGGYNRAGFINAVERLRCSGGNMTDYALLFVNIQGFKAINRNYGLEAGDNLLRILYMTFYRSSLMPKLAARKESDHFVFLVEKDKLDLEVLAENLELKWIYNTHQLRVNCHAGVYYVRENDEDVQDMIARARLAIGYIKDSYVKPYEIFDCYMEHDYLQQADVINNFDNALVNNEFKVYYQPIIDAQTGKITAAEALIRWFSPTNGFIPPNIFIPVLEEYGSVCKVDSFVLHDVYRYMEERHKQGLPIVPVSVNLSRMDFYDADFLNIIKSLTTSNRLPSGSVRYEITETAYASIELLHNDFLDIIHQLGSKIILDDFGTGYSSFGMIKNFDFDVLKIDMSFVRQLETNPKVRSIISSIISMCHELGIKIVAEGVENESELEFLKSKNCDFIQGYYFSKPLSEEDFTKFVEENLKAGE